MTTVTNPGVLRIPPALTRDREVASYFSQVNRILFELYQNSTGSGSGGGDIIQQFSAGANGIPLLSSTVIEPSDMTIDTEGFYVSTEELTTDMETV